MLNLAVILCVVFFVAVIVLEIFELPSLLFWIAIIGFFIFGAVAIF